MSQELIYTAAPQGLKPGSRGFCTVAATSGMHAALSERLEALSAYRHVFPPKDPKESLNPVSHSHLKFTIGGRQCHVLSRICAAGLSYTQRANLFAHHLVLDAVELPAGGPAWLLSQPGVMESDWKDEPQALPPSRKAFMGNTSAGVCRRWQELTGDAGWGGVLAETATKHDRVGALIIYRPGMDVLPLVAESLALLPPDERWDVTFSTYYTKLPPGIECRWRFVLEGSPEATNHHSPSTTVIDLCGPLKAPAETPWVEAARSGFTPYVDGITPALPHSDASTEFMELESEQSDTEIPIAAPSFSATQSRLNQIDQRSDASAPRAPVITRLFPPQIPVAFPDLPSHAHASRERSTLPWIICISILLIGGAAAVVVVLWKNGSEKGSAGIETSKSTSNVASSVATDSVSHNEAQLTSTDNARSPPVEESPTPPAHEGQAETTDGKTKTDPPELNKADLPKTEEKLEKPPIDPLAALRKRSVFQLAPYRTIPPGLTSDTDPNRATQSIGQFDCSPEMLNIEIQDLNILFPKGNGRNRCSKLNANAARDSISWDVILHRATAIDSFEPNKVASIVAENGILSFKWLPAAANISDINQLRNAVLSIHCEGPFAPVSLRLRDPIVEGPLLFLPGNNANYRIRSWRRNDPDVCLPDATLLHLDILLNSSRLPEKLTLVDNKNNYAKFALGAEFKVYVVVEMKSDSESLQIGFRTDGDPNNGQEISKQLSSIDKDIKPPPAGQISRLKQQKITAGVLKEVVDQLDKALNKAIPVLKAPYQNSLAPGAREKFASFSADEKLIGKFRDAVDKLSGQLEDLERNGRLEFSIFEKIDGIRVDLVTSRIQSSAE